ncbi:MAG: ABC transporter permease, partial [Egibacteraceae bacterium]
MSAEVVVYLAETGSGAVWRRFRRNRAAVTGAGLVAVVLLMALVGPLLPVPNPVEGQITDRLGPASGAHWLGTDALGRDQLARVLHGARTSVGLAIGLVAATAVVGTAVGVVAGLAGGLVDALLMRTVDVVLAFPSLVLALAITGFLGPGLGNV